MKSLGARHNAKKNHNGSYEIKAGLLKGYTQKEKIANDHCLRALEAPVEVGWGWVWLLEGLLLR